MFRLQVLEHFRPDQARRFVFHKADKVGQGQLVTTGFPEPFPGLGMMLQVLGERRWPTGVIFPTSCGDFRHRMARCGGWGGGMRSGHGEWFRDKRGKEGSGSRFRPQNHSAAQPLTGRGSEWFSDNPSGPL